MTTRTTPIRVRQSVRHLPADMDTPISLFLDIARERDGILLESAEVDGRWGRYSVLACDMALYLICRDGKLFCRIEDERLAGLAAFDGMNFVDGLRGVMRTLEVLPDPNASDLPPITRSLCGYLGFGMASLFHPKLAPVMKPEDAECVLCLPGTLLLFDHMYNRLAQVSLGEHRDLGRCGSFARSGVPLQEKADVLAEPSEEGFQKAVEHIREMLRMGEAIQVVPSMRFSMPFSGDPFTLYRRMRSENASPYMFFMRLPGITLFGSSPEVMVRCEGGKLLSAPIAGTRRRGSTVAEDEALAGELLADPKERAEHMMLVDLGRNDLGRLARPGTVEVEKLMMVERFSHVMHLTSRVTAELDDGLDAVDVLAATFPAGTVSGAPKIRAMEIIAETEPGPRGPYAGCIGWLGLDRDGVNLDTGITIRSIWVRDGRLYWQAGAGIVHDSVPALEWKEVCNKSAIMRQACFTTGEFHVPAHR
ncbi:anthranilate synthase component I family protein [uncultured Mailhella sp.]|uniref:anthranilate synthase component I family protein n=1 Tax=uncultured Mailhella sp. TaxID=1981031 RepID=UPI0025E1F469|nr:anthranilate synthase component I family protein [uncultured Mailhella sp.]